ncbi:MAG TPA: alpha/beta hydrolase [Steroidobacteraceae bacterium]|nr:alpha/beta hydrolase [Steroidobacteraceae bacterium]
MSDSSAPVRNPPFGRTVKLPSGYEMHYREAGRGPAVVFVHGSGPGASGSSNFKQNVPQISAAGYRCILPDLVGFGWSEKPAGIDYTLELFASTLIELLDALEIDTCALIGNSLGGAVAMRLAILQPRRVSKLVLMGPGGIESRETYFQMPGIQKMVSGFVGSGFDKPGLRRLLQLLTFDPKVVTDELVEERWNVMQTQPKDVLARMMIPDQTPDLPKLRCPILGFWGIEDQFCPASGHEKILRACPGSRFELLSQCGHWAMVEYPALFNRHVVEFLDG